MQNQLQHSMVENEKMRRRISFLETRNSITNSFPFHFRDIQDLITLFSGQEDEDVNIWIIDMKSTAVAQTGPREQLSVHGKINIFKRNGEVSHEWDRSN